MLEQIKNPVSLVIFGASGNLAQLKLYPSLYEIFLQKRFGNSFTIFGLARTPMSEEEFRKKVKQSLQNHVKKELYDPQAVETFLSHFHYHTGQYDAMEDYGALSAKIKALHPKEKPEILAYLAVPPKIYPGVAKGLAQLREAEKYPVKLMLEKPFGTDRKSAGDLFHQLGEYFKKSDLFLIDHYLGKAPVQSILPLRYNNTILNLLLKGSAISNIQISALEEVGAEERIGFFDEVGIVKDMVQSHLLQILALITLSLPIHLEEQSIRREKGNILSALRYDDRECGVILGQYKSYAKLKGIKPENKTPTFVTLRAFIDLAEWYKVPIYIRAGKKTNHKHTYIVIEFKKPPYEELKGSEANRLLIELYPHEEIQMRLLNDVGHASRQRHELISEESLACMGDDCLPEYGHLILNALLGKMESFLSMDEVLASWHFVDDLMGCIQKRKLPLEIYPDGTEGPQSQHELPKMDGFKWYDPDNL